MFDVEALADSGRILPEDDVARATIVIDVVVVIEFREVVVVKDDLDVFDIRGEDRLVVDEEGSESGSRRRSFVDEVREDSSSDRM